MDCTFHPHLDEEAGKSVVRTLADVLSKLVMQNTELGRDNRRCPNSGAAPAGDQHSRLLERIFRYASCSGECFVLALVYIDRLIKRRDFVLTSLNVHRIIITAVMLAAKFLTTSTSTTPTMPRLEACPASK